MLLILNNILLFILKRFIVYLSKLKLKIMLVLKGLVSYYRNDRKDFIYSCLFMSALLVFVVGGMILSSLCEN